MSKSEYPPKTPQEKAKDPSQRLTQEEIALLKEQNSVRKQTERDATPALDKFAKQTASFDANNKMTFDQKLISLDKDYDNDRMMIQREIGEANKNNASKNEVEKIYNKLDSLESDYKKTRKSMMVRENVLGPQDDSEFSLEDSIDKAMNSVVEQQIDTLTKEHVALSGPSKNSTPEERSARQDIIMKELAVLRGEAEPEQVASDGTIFPTRPGFKTKPDGTIVGPNGEMTDEEFLKEFKEELDKELENSLEKGKNEDMSATITIPVNYDISNASTKDLLDIIKKQYPDMNGNDQVGMVNRLQNGELDIERVGMYGVVSTEQGKKSDDNPKAEKEVDTSVDEVVNGAEALKAAAIAEEGGVDMKEFEKAYAEEFEEPKGMRTLIREEFEAKQAFIDAEKTLTKSSRANPIAFVKSFFGNTDDAAQKSYDHAQETLKQARSARMEARFRAMEGGKFKKILQRQEGESTQEKLLATLRRDSIRNQTFDEVAGASSNMKEISNAMKHGSEKIRTDKMLAWYKKQPLWAKLGIAASATGAVSLGAGAGAFIVGSSMVARGVGYLAGMASATSVGSLINAKENKKIKGVSEIINKTVTHLETTDFVNMEKLANAERKDLSKIQKRYAYYKFGGSTIAGLATGGGTAAFVDNIMEGTINSIDMVDSSTGENNTTSTQESNNTVDSDNNEAVYTDQQTIESDGSQDVPVQRPLGYYDLARGDTVYEVALEKVIGESPEMSHLSEVERQNLVMNFIEKLRSEPDLCKALTGAESPDHIIAGDQIRLDGWRQLMTVDSGSLEGQSIDWSLDRTNDNAGKFTNMLEAADALDLNTVPAEVAGGYGPNGDMTFEQAQESDANKIGADVYEDDSSSVTEPSLESDNTPERNVIENNNSNFVPGIDKNTSLVQIGEIIENIKQGVPYEQIKSQLQDSVQGGEVLAQTIKNLKENFNVDTIYLSKATAVDGQVILNFSTGPDAAASFNIGFNASLGIEVAELQVDNRSWFTKLFG